MSTSKRRLTPEQLAAIQRTHELLDQIQRENRARQNSTTRLVVRKEGK